MACELELEVGPGATDEQFVVRVVQAVTGDRPTGTMSLDVDGLWHACDGLEDTVLASAVAARRALSTGELRLRDVGQQLFDALFSADVESVYRVSSSLAAERGDKLRLKLRLTVPMLTAFPWEAMYDRKTDDYICLKEPLVRHVDAPFTPEPLPVEPPLRVLGVVASPSAMAALDVDAECARLTDALKGPIGGGLIDVEWLRQATWEAVQDKLLSDTWHVVHFIGHGDYDPNADQGIIALAGANGRPHLVGADRLATLLGQASPTPRLVVLNSCESGRSGGRDLFSSTAATLVRSGISAVAAMQFTISDPGAINFARGFYSAIANGRAVDEAARSGRVGILSAPGTLEWVTPVLYVRGETTQLFDLKRVERRVTPRAEEAAPRPHQDGGVRTDDVPPQQRWWQRKKLVMAAAIATAVLVAAGITIAWLVIPGPEPSLKGGYTLAPRGLEYRSHPRVSAPSLGILPPNTFVYIACTTVGDWVEGPGSDGGPPQKTPIWDKVRTENDGKDLGFVPDAWVNTKTTEPQGPPC